MQASSGSTRAHAAERVSIALSRLESVTNLLNAHAIDGDWDVRDFAIASLMLSDLHEVVGLYQDVVANAERQIGSAASRLRELRADLEGPRETPSV